MKPYSATILTILLLFYFLAVSSPSIAGIPFLDDFEDGRFDDDVPVSWLHQSPPNHRGDISIEEGSLILSSPTSGELPFPNVPNYWETDIYVPDQLYHDIDIFAQVRALENASTVTGFGLFTNPGGIPSADDKGFYGALALDGGNRFAFLNFVRNNDFFRMDTENNTTLSHIADDLNLRFQVQGTQVSMKAWAVGEVEPDAPQLSGILPTDFADIQANIFLFAGNRSVQVPVAYRFVEVRVPNESPCDFNRDNICNVLDIDALTRIGNLELGVQPGDPGYDTEFDLNGDSLIGQADIIEWLGAAAAENGYTEPYSLGDTNLDGVVNFEDFVNLNNNWQATHLASGPSVAWSSGDFDGSGIVAFPDFVVQNNNWQRIIGTAGAVAVPEPSTFALCWFGGFFLWRRHR